MAEYLQAPPRRKALGLLADALTSGQEALNTVNLPYVGGLGGLLFGQAPQYLQDVSYGMPAFRGGNVATGGLGTFTPDTRMLDVATLPFVGAGAAKAGQVGAKTLGKEVARQVETGTGLIGSNVLDPRQYATAYHGSPAIFDKFDISKVGSGEGAQVYGHGMYFAENPQVAQSYKKDFIQTNKMIESLKNFRDQYPIDSADWTHYNNLMNRNKTGNLYKVDIPDTKIPKMIDWDTSLQNQPEVLKTLGVGEKEINRYNAIKKELNAMPGQYDIDIPKEKAMFDKHTALERELNDIGLHKTGQKYYEDLIKKYGSAKNVSEELNKKGITGIKYLDAHSRGIIPRMEERPLTSNYVLFDPSDVKILEKGLLK